MKCSELISDFYTNSIGEASCSILDKGKKLINNFNKIPFRYKLPMRQFINLGKYIVNTSTIKYVTIAENKYYVTLLTPDISGFSLFGSGQLSTSDDNITVCAEKNADSYKTLSEWIQSVTK